MNKKVKLDTTDDIYLWKEYYNRALVMRIIQGFLLAIVVVLSLISAELLLVLLYLVVLSFLGISFAYLSPKSIDIETFAEKDINEGFWLNRHIVSVCTSITYCWIMLLANVNGMLFIGFSMGLTFMVGDQYRLLAQTSFLLFSMSIVAEIVFSLTWGYYDYSAKTLEQRLDKTEHQVFGLELKKE